MNFHPILHLNTVDWHCGERRVKKVCDRVRVCGEHGHIELVVSSKTLTKIADGKFNAPDCGRITMHELNQTNWFFHRVLSEQQNQAAVRARRLVTPGRCRLSLIAKNAHLAEPSFFNFPRR